MIDFLNARNRALGEPGRGRRATDWPMVSSTVNVPPDWAKAINENAPSTRHAAVIKFVLFIAILLNSGYFDALQIAAFLFVLANQSLQSRYLRPLLLDLRGLSLDLGMLFLDGVDQNDADAVCCH